MKKEWTLISIRPGSERERKSDNPELCPSGTYGSERSRKHDRSFTIISSGFIIMLSAIWSCKCHVNNVSSVLIYNIFPFQCVSLQIILKVNTLETISEIQIMRGSWSSSLWMGRCWSCDDWSCVVWFANGNYILDQQLLVLGKILNSRSNFFRIIMCEKCEFKKIK